MRLHEKVARPNGHRIDHNYFGPRPYLGVNGAESLKIGSSAFAHHDSGTIVERNLFDRADGEGEIISVKAGANILRENVFVRSSGALTLRHGNGNLVERNIFFGHGKRGTGGIRIIGEDHIVRENYMEGLAGTGLRSAISVMNGGARAPAHGHHRVRNVRIENNTVVASRRVTIGAGANNVRTEAPVETAVRENVFDGPRNLILIESSASGMTFQRNFIPSDTEPIVEGLMPKDVTFDRAYNCLLYPTDDRLSRAGVPRDLRPIGTGEVGVSWYEKLSIGRNRPRDQM